MTSVKNIKSDETPYTGMRIEINGVMVMATPNFIDHLNDALYSTLTVVDKYDYETQSRTYFSTSKILQVNIIQALQNSPILFDGMVVTNEGG